MDQWVGYDIGCIGVDGKEGGMEGINSMDWLNDHDKPEPFLSMNRHQTSRRLG